jgi:hypothetical protein
MMMKMTGDKRLGLFFDCWVFARCPGLRLGFCFLVRFCWLYCSPTTFHPAKALTAVGTVGRLSRYLIQTLLLADSTRELFLFMTTRLPLQTLSPHLLSGQQQFEISETASSIRYDGDFFNGLLTRT